MRKHRWIWTLALILVMGSAAWVAADTAGMDAPHNNYTNGIECGSCHLLRNGTLPFWYSGVPLSIDDTIDNRTCQACHNDIQAPAVKTHSSVSTDNGYGSWNAECVDCHFGWTDSHGAHAQKSFAGSKLVEGTVLSVNYVAAARKTEITLNVTAGDLGSKPTWSRYIIYTQAGSRSYQIKSSGGSTVTVDGDASADAGTNFYIIYGKNLNKTIGVSSAVHFFDNGGTHGFIDTAGDGGMGVCETCHTQTRFFQNSVRGSQGHVASTEDCASCHKHRDGFAAISGCAGCHGDGTVAGYPTNTGNMVDPPTGEPVGAHAAHIPNAGGDTPTTCNVCHNNHNMPVEDQVIHLEFTGLAGTIGTFDGPTTLLNGYSYGGPGAAPATGSRVCSNVSCHDDGTGTLVPTPAWDATPPQCTECHNSRPSTGSHTAHLDDPVSAPACGTCHQGAVEGATAPAGHRDGNIDTVAALGYPLNKTKGTPGASCATASCHFDGYSLVASPNWGTLVTDCSECHANQPTTGSHTVHISAGANCGNCHVGAVQGTTAPTTGHRNGTRAADGDCNTCHNDGQSGNDIDAGLVGASPTTVPTWGTDAPVCGACHVAVPSSAKHNEHLGMYLTNPGTYPEPCGGCHLGAGDGSTLPTANHLNGQIDVRAETNYTAGGTPGNGWGSCNNAFGNALCHDSTLRDWDATTAACNSCHGGSGTDGAPRVAGDLNPASTLPVGQHAAHVDTVGLSCNSCHSGHNMPVTDGKITINFTDARALTGTYDAPNPSSWTYDWPSTTATQDCSNLYCHSSGQASDGGPSDPVFATPVWGDAATGACGTCHGDDGSNGLKPDIATGSHSAHLGDTVTNPTCDTCHAGNTHVNQQTEVVAGMTYSAGGSMGNGFGTCATASCHNNGFGTVVSPQWGTSPAQCSECHAVVPGTGSHTVHLADTVENPTCGTCHNGAVQGSTAPTAGHRDGTTAADLGGYNDGTQTCSAASCHFDGISQVTSPTWGTSVTDCSECHATVPTTGSHTIHISATAACGDCHNGAVQGSTAPTSGHRNGFTAADLGTYDDASTQTCSTAVCHTNGQDDGGTGVTQLDSPQWGTAGGCGICHAAVPTTGSHNSHIGYGAVCDNCHNTAGDGTTLHFDGNIDVIGGLTFNATAVSMIFSQAGAGNNTPGTGYGSCDNVSCHSNAFSRDWGGAADCAACHNYSASDWTTPTHAEMQPEAIGAHAKHITELMSPERRNIAVLDPIQGQTDGFGQGQNAQICGVCHTNLIAQHMNGEPNRLVNFGDGQMEFSFDGLATPVYLGTPGTSSNVNPPNNEKRCSNVSCHFQDTPLWGNPNP